MKTKILTENLNFRGLLQEVLLERCRQNPNYSLRSFAKSLDINPSALSEIMRKKRVLSTKMIERLGLRMGLSMEDVDKYKFSFSDQTDHFSQISMDTFAIISDWYHYGILELMKVRGFQPNPQWIAKKLGLTKSEVTIAIERLQRVNLLQISKKGEWTDNSMGFSSGIIDSQHSSEASRSLQKQLLEKALESLQDVPSGLRNNTSMTMAINKSDLPKAIEKIKNFRRSLSKTLEANPKKTDVYNLSVALFPLNKLEKGEKK